MRRNTVVYRSLLLCVSLLLLSMLAASAQFQAPGTQNLNLDKRVSSAKRPVSAEKADAAQHLKLKVKDARVDLDKRTGSPAWIGSPGEFLTGPNGKGGTVSDAASAGIPSTDADKPVKGFLREYSGLFGHGPEALANAVKVQDAADKYGIRSVAWKQQLDDLPVLDSGLSASITAKGELMCIHGSLVPNLYAAAEAGTPNWHQVLRQPPVSAADAVMAASAGLGSTMSASDLSLLDGPNGPTARTSFESPALSGKAEASLAWLRMDESSLKLCWQVFLKPANGELFQVLVDAVTGETIVRNSLTFHGMSWYTYAFYEDSPMPMTPGLSTPSATLPPLVGRSSATLTSLNPAASPVGWLPDLHDSSWDNYLVGGWNVVPYLYPSTWYLAGDPYHVFYPTTNLNSTGAFASLTSDNWQAGAVNAFYWGNVMHDRLWDNGFGGTIAYGFIPGWNQYDRFQRPDPVYIILREFGDQSSYAEYVTENGMSPNLHIGWMTDTLAGGYRDIGYDSETLIHEYGHLVSLRTIAAANGGASVDHWENYSYYDTMYAMFEGLSDFYALTFLSHPYDDNPNGNYGGTYPYDAFTALAMRNWSGFPADSYYYGIRRLPYSTDRTKNPLTIMDCGVFDVGTVPYNNFWNGNFPVEYHNAGEVWGSILWDLRANMIQKTGDDNNEAVLKLVTNTLWRLYPSVGYWETIRDAMLQTDTVINGGKYRQEIWDAFAGRGLGKDAHCDFWYTGEWMWYGYNITEDYTPGFDSGLASQVPTPAFNPVGGWYYAGQSVNITCADSGATIRYTTDGSDPTTSSTQYTGTAVPVNSTTVLKAKAWHGTTPESRIRENLYTIRTPIPWERPNGASVSIQGVVTAVFDVSGSKWIYIENQDRLWGIRVVAASSISVQAGWVVDVQGIVQTDLTNGDRYILANAGYPMRNGTNTVTINSLGMRNNWLGGDSGGYAPPIRESFGYYNVGLLVQTWGKVIYTDAANGYFVIDDGSRLTDPYAGPSIYCRGVRVKLPAGAPMPAFQSTVKVTGVLGTAREEPANANSFYVRKLMPRSSSDIVAVTSWHTQQVSLTCDQQNYFSLPGIPQDSSPWTVMTPCTGGLLWPVGNLYRWDAMGDYWAPFDEGCAWEIFGYFLVGDGFRYRHQRPDNTYTCAPCITVQLADVTGDQFISLPNGSNPLTPTSHSLIGNPFNASKSWSSIQVADGNSLKTLPQAVTDGSIVAVKVWNGTTLQTVDFGTSTMDPLKAYEIYPKYDKMAMFIPAQ